MDEYLEALEEYNSALAANKECRDTSETDPSYFCYDQEVRVSKAKDNIKNALNEIIDIRVSGIVNRFYTGGRVT